MTTRLSKIDPLSAGKVFAIIYFGFSLIYVPFFLLFSLSGLAMPNTGGGPNPFQMMAGAGIIFLLFFMLMMVVFGFVAGIIAALIYNVAAHFTGGLEMTFVELAPTLRPGFGSLPPPPTYGAPLPPR